MGFSLLVQLDREESMILTEPLDLEKQALITLFEAGIEA